MKNCPHCSKPIDEFSEFCPYCMERLIPVQTIQRITKKAGAGRKSLTAALALLLIVALTCAVLPFLKDETVKQTGPDPVPAPENEETVVSYSPESAPEPALPSPSSETETALRTATLTKTPEVSEVSEVPEVPEEDPEPMPSSTPESVEISETPVPSPSPEAMTETDSQTPELPQQEATVVSSAQPSHTPEPAESQEPEPTYQSVAADTENNISLMVWGSEEPPGAVFGSGRDDYTEITVLLNGEPTADFTVEVEYPDKIDWTKSDDGKLLIRDADENVRSAFTVMCSGASANYIWDSIGPDNPMEEASDVMKLKFLEFTVLPTVGFGGAGFETYYITVMVGDEVVTDFTAYVDDPAVCTVGKSENGQMTITNVNGGITKLHVTVGDMSEIFEWNGGIALNAESRRITVKLYDKIAPAGSVFGTNIPGEHGVTVMLDGQMTSDYTFEIADTSVCTAYKAEDGRLMVTNVGVGETKLSITSGQRSAEFIWLCGSKI